MLLFWSRLSLKRSMSFLINPSARLGTRAAELLRGYEGRQDCMLVAGGDGTVHRLINEEGTGQPLALIPSGTANDLAREIGVPLDPIRALASLEKAVPFSMDLVTVNGVRVATSAGLGLPHRIALRAERWKRQLALAPLGRWIYLVTTVRELGRFTLPVYRFRVSHFDGVEVFSGHSLLIMNQKRVGACLTLAPKARNDDGHFDIVIFRHHSGWRTLAALPWRMGLVHRRYRRARIEVDVPVPFIADGELYPETSHFDINTLPGGLKVMRPPEIRGET